MRASASEFLAGMRDEAPILVGVVPFGMIFGVFALQAGLGAIASQAMSSVVFAGSAQLIMVRLLGSGAPLGVVVLTAFIVNLRHALYSASIAPYLSGLRMRWKLILSYLLTDEAYAVVITRYSRDPPELGRASPWYLLGAGLAL